MSSFSSRRLTATLMALAVAMPIPLAVSTASPTTASATPTTSVESPAGATTAVASSTAFEDTTSSDHPSDSTRTTPTLTPTAEGINDPSCRPSPAHPTPVVFLHGTSSNIGDFKLAATTLRASGYCVWGTTYGTGGNSVHSPFPSIGAVIDINESAQQAAGIIDEVRHRTGADKVDIIGHSQGGLLTKVLVQKLGKSTQIRRVVALGAPFHGTDVNGMGPGLRGFISATPAFARWILSTASTQQIVGSEFLAELNALPDTAPGIVYTSIYSPADTTVTPNITSMLEEVPGAQVANVSIAEACPAAKPVTHPNLPKTPVTVSLMRWGLERANTERLPSSCA